MCATLNAMKRFISQPTPLYLLATLSAFSVACASASSPGVSVAVAVSPSMDPGQSFLLSNGAMRIDELRWTNAAIEIEACPNLGQAVMDWLVPAARAHGTSSPTRMAVPTLVTPTQQNPVGELRPTPGQYCSARLEIGPADSDTLGLAAAPDMLGVSLFVRGAFDTGAAALIPFELRSDRTFEVTLDVGWELSSDQPSITLSSTLDVERWVGQLDPGELVLGDEALLQAFQGSFAVTVE